MSVDDLAVLREPSREGLGLCRVTGTVEQVTKRPLFGVLGRGPRVGDTFAIEVRCWNDDLPLPGPPGPTRLTYGGGHPTRGLELWLSRWFGEWIVQHMMARDDAS